MRTNRKNDSNAEQELGKFLDEYCYPHLQFRPDMHWTRSSDPINLNDQYAGIDGFLSFNSANGVREIRTIDEKAALQYLNKNLPTFALELSFLERNGIAPHPGWLIDEQKKTDYYLFMWPNAQVDPKTEQTPALNAIKKDDFTFIDASLVSRKLLKE